MSISQYNVRNGMEYGAFAGFIASIAFIGVTLWLPLILSLPVGVFLHALGLSVTTPIVCGDAIHVDLVGFGLVVAQGVLVGLIFGMVTSKIKRLHIYNYWGYCIFSSLCHNSIDNIPSSPHKRVD